MTIMQLDELAATHGLWNFDISTGHRPSEGIILKRKVGGVITIVIKINQDTEEIYSRGIYVHTDLSLEPEWYELTDEQIKELSFFIN